MRFRRASGTFAALIAALVCSVAGKHNEAVSTKSWQDEVQTRRAPLRTTEISGSIKTEFLHRHDVSEHDV